MEDFEHKLRKIIFFVLIYIFESLNNRPQVYKIWVVISFLITNLQQILVYKLLEHFFCELNVEVLNFLLIFFISIKSGPHPIFNSTLNFRIFYSLSFSRNQLGIHKHTIKHVHPVHWIQLSFLTHPLLVLYIFNAVRYELSLQS